jgi:hypothetical protein
MPYPRYGNELCRLAVRRTVRGVEIRPCGVDDVERLEQAMPTGLTRSHARRFQRQRQGLGTFLVAWLRGTPAGSGKVR